MKRAVRAIPAVIIAVVIFVVAACAVPQGPRYTTQIRIGNRVYNCTWQNYVEPYLFAGTPQLRRTRRLISGGAVC